MSRASHPLIAQLLLALSASGGEHAVQDPKPPTVHAVPSAKPAEAREYPELVFHAAPRVLAADAVTEDWPTFLGPRRDAHTRETRLATSFAEGGPPLVWEMRCGIGFASPIVAQGKLVFTHRIENEIHVDCLEPETGKRFWRFSFPCAFRDRYIPNDGPRSTPTIAGDRLYVHGLENDLFCLDLASGSVVWQRDLAEEFSVALDYFGAVSSPLVYGDVLIQNLGAPGGPCVAAFDLATGRLAWGSGTKWGPSCASPVIARVHGKDRLFVLAGGDSKPPTGGLVVLDPANGALQHEYAFRSKLYESVNGSSPVVAGERVFVSASYGTGSACLAIGVDGHCEELWTDRHLGLQFSTAVYEGGHLWAIDGVADRAGALVCLDPATGKELGRTDLVWDETFELEGKELTRPFTVGEGSLLHAEGKFLCLGDNGHLLWIEATPKSATILSRAWLFRANESWTPPVVSRGLLYLRQSKRERFGTAPPRLLCYDLRERALQ